jgi:peptidoglycan biosynthesis protein MviN/MurJ (putative lipid II flippase)
MLTLVGYVVQETLARAFYARLEPKIPLMGVGLRLVLYVAVVGIGFSFFRAVGAPVIAAGELAVLAEAGFLFLLLSKKSGQVIRVRSSFFRGTAALVMVGLLWVVVGWVSPAGSVVVSLLAIGASGLAALAIVWKDASSVLRL